MAAVENTQRNAMASLVWRVSGALRLGGAAFEDAEQDRGAMGQAAAVVVAAGFARGLGVLHDEGVVGLIGSPIIAVAVWLGAGVMIWGIGVKRLHYSADYPELLRTIGFAAAPLLFLALGGLPLGALRPWLWVGAHVWATLALVVATREALDVPLIRALGVCALALGVTLATVLVVSFLLVAGIAA
jgi:hypothetical protein